MGFDHGSPGPRGFNRRSTLSGTTTGRPTIPADRQGGRRVRLDRVGRSPGQDHRYSACAEPRSASPVDQREGVLQFRGACFVLCARPCDASLQMRPKIGVLIARQRSPTLPVVRALGGTAVHGRACAALANHSMIPGGTPERPDDAETPLDRLGTLLPHGGKEYEVATVRGVGRPCGDRTRRH